MNDKQLLRRHIRQLKSHHTPIQLKELSAPIIDRLRHHPRLLAARCIMLYSALEDEVATEDLIELLYQQGKDVLLPRVIADGQMEVRHYQGSQSLRQGAYHIMEPMGPVCEHPDMIEVAVVPGMCFDAQGNRLGRGKGYYDRFLAQCPRIYKIGICFDFQKMPHIPSEPTDIRMDEVL